MPEVHFSGVNYSNYYLMMSRAKQTQYKDCLRPKNGYNNIVIITYYSELYIICNS